LKYQPVGYRCYPANGSPPIYRFYANDLLCRIAFISPQFGIPYLHNGFNAIKKIRSALQVEEQEQDEDNCKNSYQVEGVG
jgi:hypothetical protein